MAGTKQEHKAIKEVLGTDKKTSEDISKEFYKIASSFSVNTNEEYTTITIEGLQENFEKAVQLYENLLQNAKPNEAALENLKARLTKTRNDAKLNKNAIMQGLTSYAIYGEKNKFNYVLTDLELQKITSTELINLMKNLNNYPQQIIYYGPEKIKNIIGKLGKSHPKATKTIEATKTRNYTPIQNTQNQVLFANYDMVQAETKWVRNTEKYNPENQTITKVFNNYFGGGMGAIVFQTIRESKALAYSTYAYYNMPNKKTDYSTIVAYVGSQSDKFNEAVTAMNELLNTLPKLAQNLNLAKGQAKKDIETERITQDNIIYNYLAAKDLGINEDIRRKIYQTIDSVTYSDLEAFHKKHLSQKPFTYTIVASDKNVKRADLEKIGPVKTLSLEQIFGY